MAIGALTSILGGGGGFSGSSSATSGGGTLGGAVGFGGFNFQPKGGSFPPMAWAALAAVAAVALIVFGARRKR